MTLPSVMAAASAVQGSDAPPDALLEAYRPGDFFFSSPRGSLLARGVHLRVAAAGGASSIAERARAALRQAAANGIADPIVVGVLPYAPEAPGTPSALIVPRSVRRGPPVTAAFAWAPPAGATAPAFSIEPDPDRAAYMRSVSELVARIQAGELEKAVLARTLRLRGRVPIDTAGVLRALVSADPHAYGFAVDLPADSGGLTRTLVGASPELLVERRGAAVRSVPLAGSAGRVQDPDEDRRLAHQLAASAKDLHEHRYVVCDVSAVLGERCVDVRCAAMPELLSTPTMWHLSTPIEARLRDPGISSLGLAAALHPTPAVGGVPREAARRAIAQLESFSRGFYAGAVGWCDADGDGEWAIAIRCAEIEDATARLFAGAGIVASSEPAAELAETDAKLRTLLIAMGLDDGSARRADLELEES